MVSRVLILQRTLYIDDILSRLVNTHDIEIVGVTVSSEKQKEDLLSQYPGVNVITHPEIFNWNQSYVTQRDIQSYYSTQLKVERDYFRMNEGSAHIMSVYYSALAFWLHIFTQEIDCVIVRGLEHGSPVETIPMDIAKKRMIPVFNIEVTVELGEISLKAIRCYNSERYINLRKLDPALPIFDIYSCLSSHKVPEGIVETGKYRKNYESSNSFLGRFKLRRKFFTERGLNMKWAIPRMVSNWIYTKRLKHFYQKHAIKIDENGKNYILYALHLEPEATILNRVTYNSQIYNIRMLADALPDDWILYVKEHPHHFNLLTPKRLVRLLEHIPNYRNIAYYKELLSINHVKLLDVRVSSKEILTRAANGDAPGLRAIATINGTIALESIFARIPVIMFGHKTTPYGALPDVFGVTAFSDITDTFKKISSPTYKNSFLSPENELEQYLFLATDGSGYHISEKALQTLVLNAKYYSEL